MIERKINSRAILIINIILLIFLIVAYRYIFSIEKVRKVYAEEMVAFAENNENPVFSIDKIIIHNSAHAVDNSDGELSDIDISQFSDLEIFIDNKGKSEEITGENTINEMYITNIKIESQEKNGEKILNYKNPHNCGKYVDLNNWEADGILFNITRTNDEDEEANYDHNIFYTDCSNPISLGYINKNILEGCAVSKDLGTIAFDGRILKSANIDKDDLNSKISFSINITNNFNEKFVCNLTIDLNFESEDEGIYDGYFIKILNPEGQNYNFIKVSD